MTRKMLMFLLVFSVVFTAEVTAFVSDASDAYVEVSMTNTVVVTGFQFDIVADEQLNAVYGDIINGDVVSAWTVAGNPSGTIIGFDMLGGSVAPGTHVLLQVSWTPDTSASGNINLGLIANSFTTVDENGDVTAADSEAGDDFWYGGLGVEGLLVNSFALEANYPNPFNPTTNISYSIPEFGEISLIVFDALGKEVKTLVTGEIAPGAYNAVWNGTDNNGNEVSTGMYFYKLTSGEFTQTRKMMFVK